MEKIKEQAPTIGLVLAIVFLIIGLNYNNSALLILGLIFLAVGLFARFRKRNHHE
jgi:LPXTG-motif cell wall-anchored protein